MVFEDLKTGDIFVSNDTIYMRTNNSINYYDNAIILYGVRKGTLVRFCCDDEVESIEEYIK